MNRLLLLTACIALTLLAPPIRAEPVPVSAFKPLLEKLDLQDGDTLVFLGDSITHQCLYTQYVEDYFYTRFPAAHLHFHNAGVGGDRAADALTRFDEDVAPFKPKYVTILLGMNDGGYRDFDPAVFGTYQTGMTTILEKISALGATAIPMTPTMFDGRAKRLRGDALEPRNTFYNGVLALYGAWLREQAETRGLGFVDMYSPLNDLTDKQRKTQPGWTMMPDGVHPGPTGQVVMAAAVIDDMVGHSPVSQVVLAEKGGKLTTSCANGTLADVQKTEDTASFTFTAKSLPWVLPAEAAEGAKLTAIGHRLGSEKLTVRNLKPGKYELKIDGASVGEFTEGQLGAGVELESNEKTPQYQQALKVALLNQQRNGTAYHPLRDLYSQLKVKRRELAKVNPGDPELETKKANFDAWHTEQQARVADLLAAAKKIEDQIYAANQPPPRKYELTPVK